MLSKNYDNIIFYFKYSSPLFFLEKKYWNSFCKKRKNRRRIRSLDHKEYNSDNMTNHDSIKAEKEKVLQNNDENNDCKGLRITKLNKIFRNSTFGIRTSPDVHAVKDIYLEVNDCELLALIGHNGAGKFE